MSTLSRRKLITGTMVLVAAPAIVRVSSLMPLRGERLFTIGSALDEGEAGALYGRLTHHIRVQRLIEGLKRDGLWGKLDHLWIFDSPDGCVDIMKPEGGEHGGD